MLDADGAAAVEDLRAELVRAKEQARKSDAAALKAAEELKDLLKRASIQEDHRSLMSMVIERISFAESGLHEAVRSLLTGFEVRKKMTYLLTVLVIECALYR